MKLTRSIKNKRTGLRKVKNDGEMSEKIILWAVIPTALMAIVFIFRKQLGLGTNVAQRDVDTGSTYTGPGAKRA